jgi:hypothetical protein
MHCCAQYIFSVRVTGFKIIKQKWVNEPRTVMLYVKFLSCFSFNVVMLTSLESVL